MSEPTTEYKVPGRQEVSRDARLPFADPRYRAPSTDDVRAALRKAGLTGSQAGQIVGVDGRTIRKWTGGERDIPYSAWRLLLIYAGLDLKGRGSVDRMVASR